MKRHAASVLVIGFIVIFYVLTAVLPQVVTFLRKPEAIYYGFFASHDKDYSHYIAIIRHTLEEGGILFHNQYSHPGKPDVLFTPFYNVLAFAGKPFSQNQFALYFWARAFLSIAFTLGVIFFIWKTYTKPTERLVAAILSLSSGAMWYIDSCGAFTCYNSPETYVRHHLSSFSRYLVLPPHHYAALILFFVNILLLKNMKKTPLWLFLYAGSVVVMSLFHPYIGLCWVGIFALYGAISSLHDKKLFFHYLPIFVLTILLTAPIALITKHAHNAMAGGTGLYSFVPYSFPKNYGEYVKGMGFILVPFFASLLLWNTWRRSMLFRFYVAWAAFPLLAFAFPYVNQLMGMYRLFQVVPHVAAGLFSTLIFTQVIGKYKKAGSFLTGTILMLFLFYHALYSKNQIEIIASKYNNEFNRYDVFVSLQIPASYLKTVVDTNDVVIAAEQGSTIIPSLIKAHTIVGHEGNSGSFWQRLDAVRRFYAGIYTKAELLSFLHEYHATYAIFGFETQPFSQSIYYKDPMFEEVFLKKGISVVKINNIQ